jgi:hypothetical protein
MSTFHVCRKAKEEECDLTRASQLLGMTKEKLVETMKQNRGVFENEYWIVYEIKHE